MKYNWFQLENEFPSIEFEYHDGVPDCDEFFTKELKRNEKTLLIFDDLYDSIITSDVMCRAFKVFSKKIGFSIILTSQSFFERGKHATTIRLNTEVIVAFENYGNYSLNSQIANRLGFTSEYRYAKEVYDLKHGYILYNLSSYVPSRDFRLCTNLFRENGQYPVFYTR